MGFDGSLTYFANEKATIVGGFSKDYKVGIAGDVIDNTTSSIDLLYNVTPEFTTSATLAFISDTYEVTGREDDFTFASIGASYIPTSFMTVSGEIILQTNDSNRESVNFDGNVFSLSVNVRY